METLNSPAERVGSDEICALLAANFFKYDSTDHNGVQLFTRNDTNVFVTKDGLVTVTFDFLP